MALVINDRVKETTTTTGTGTLNLAGAVTGFETFVAGVGDGNTTYYAITLPGTAEFEVGLGTITDASPDTLARTTIISSSNSDSAVNFSAGTKTIFCTLPASKTVFLDASGNSTFGGDVTVTGETTLVTHLNMADNAIIKLGADADLQISHNGSNSIIRDNGTGALDLQVSNFAIVNLSSDEFLAKGTADGAFELYNDGTKRIETTSNGVTVTGDLTVTGDDITMGTNTSGHVLVADGTNYNPVAISGDVSIASNGAVTIAAGAVENSMLADDAVGADELAANAVVTASIVDDNVTQAKIADDAVGADELAANAVVNASVASGAAIAFSKMADLTASRALVSDGSGDVSVSAVTSTEIGYLDGVTSAIQTQIDTKASKGFAVAMAIAL